MVAAMFSPESFDVDVKFVRHSPGRRRNDTTMYDVCLGSVAQAESIRARFAGFIRRDKPIQRPPQLANISIHPLVSISVYYLLEFYSLLCGSRSNCDYHSSKRTQPESGLQSWQPMERATFVTILEPSFVW